MRIREYDRGADSIQIRKCVIELQDFERKLDPRLPTGEEIADMYITETLQRCRACDGQILVAEVDGDIAGYVTLLNRVQSDDLDDGDVEFGLIADLVVREKYRGAGLGRKMMAAAESAAMAGNVRWLRISVMAANGAARQLYSSAGFSELYVELEKDLGNVTNDA